MNKKRTIIAAIVLLLLFCIGGAVAYFTDTETATNTFTIGDVDIELKEDAWNAANAQDLMPGMTVAKDPTVNNIGPNPAYVFVKVEAPCTTGTGAKELFEYSVDTTKWSEIETKACTNGTAEHVYLYASPVQPEGTTGALFSQVVVTSLDGTEAGLDGDKNMVVTAYAIQSQGLTVSDPATLWSNFS